MTNELELLDRLSKIELFQDFSSPTEQNSAILKKVLATLHPKTFKAGDTIIKEGEDGDSLFILTAGEVRILRKTVTNETFAVANLKAEQNIFFGEVTLLDHEKRSATVIALTDCEALQFTREKFFKICEKDPLIGFRVTLRIAQRLSMSLRKANGDITTLYQALIEEIDN